MKRATIILIWIISIMFVATGLSKFMHLDPMSPAMFEKAHLPFWLLYIAAAFELIGGILLLIGKYRRYGALMIITVMIGAIGTHLYLKDDLVHIIVPVLIIVFAGSIILKKK